MAGPLDGLKVIEMVGLGPAPFCAMLMADLGAQVTRVDRPGGAGALGLETRFDVAARGRRSLAIDLRRAGAAEVVLRGIEQADVLLEGYRPGVMERLGLGPDVCLQRRPSLVYGRMTGWGQHGPLAATAGHDIDYIALTGALHAIGSAGGPPLPPLNYVGDYGGGAMMLAFGVMCALHEAQRSGRGQVVDAAMTDGAALLSAMFHGLKAAGAWAGPRGGNLLDGGAHFYRTYECADGRFVAVGALEPAFHAELLRRLGVDDPEIIDHQLDATRWPNFAQRLAVIFRTRTRDEWCTVFDGSDACVAPVLDFDEAPRHPHHRAREAYVVVDGVVQPAPAPRFSRTPAGVPRGPAASGADSSDVLRSWGWDDDSIACWRRDGIVAGS